MDREVRASGSREMKRNENEGVFKGLCSRHESGGSPTVESQRRLHLFACLSAIPCIRKALGRAQPVPPLLLSPPCRQRPCPAASVPTRAACAPCAPLHWLMLLAALQDGGGV